MTDAELAQELIQRLNGLCKDPLTREILQRLCWDVINVPESLVQHPTIQVTKRNDGVEDYYLVGLLGILNGLVGVVPEGSKKGWGYLQPILEEGRLQGFQLALE